jgi:hypothetical protein
MGNTVYVSTQSGYLFSGANIPSGLSGNFSTGTYGYGAVYGVIAKDSGFCHPYGKFDMCLLDNPVWSGFSGDQGWGTTPNPTGETGLLCWPYPGKSIGLTISGMQYFHPNFNSGYFYDDPNDYISKSGFQLVGDFTGVGGSSVISSSGAGTYTLNGISVILNSSHKITFSTATGTASILAATNGTAGFSPTNFCKPSGKIHHVESYFPSYSGRGYRLLPNYASGNNDFTGQYDNTYSSIRGGSFPGLSSENGMQLYFDFIWSG